MTLTAASSAAKGGLILEGILISFPLEEINKITVQQLVLCKNSWWTSILFILLKMGRNWILRFSHLYYSENSLVNSLKPLKSFSLSSWCVRLWLKSPFCLLSWRYSFSWFSHNGSKLITLIKTYQWSIRYINLKYFWNQKTINFSLFQLLEFSGGSRIRKYFFYLILILVVEINKLFNRSDQRV